MSSWQTWRPAHAALSSACAMSVCPQPASTPRSGAAGTSSAPSSSLEPAVCPRLAAEYTNSLSTDLISQGLCHRTSCSSEHIAADLTAFAVLFCFSCVSFIHLTLAGKYICDICCGLLTCFISLYKFDKSSKDHTFSMTLICVRRADLWTHEQMSVPEARRAHGVRADVPAPPAWMKACGPCSFFHSWSRPGPYERSSRWVVTAAI